MTDKIEVTQLTGVIETLLPVLYSRVFETRQPNPIIQDPIAVEWVEQIDYDFSRFDDAVKNHLGVAIRTVIFDCYTQTFLDQHPQATVINIASGLDTRFYRMDNGQLRWIELDLPESIAVRKQLMQETERHYTLEASALETDWIDELATDKPVLFIVEGLLMYFTEEQIKGMLGAITERFPNATLLLEILGKTQAKKTHLNDAISKTDAEFKFGIRDASQMGQWHPHLHYVEDTSLYDLHEERWLALDIDWKGKPISAYRNSIGRVVHLRVVDKHI